jgi:hypothetical protein
MIEDQALIMVIHNIYPLVYNIFTIYSGIQEVTYLVQFSECSGGEAFTLLSTEFVGNALGQLKLEYVIKKAVFLAPKVYGLITVNENGDNIEIIKAKGLTKDSIKNIKVSDLELLLNKDSIKLFNQDKSFKNLFNSDIKVLNTAYTLKITSNKRKLIYSVNIEKVFSCVYIPPTVSLSDT